MQTQPTKLKEIQRKWHLVDLRGKVLGREAGTIAQLLRGKNKPYFVHTLDCGDYVVVINSAEVVVTGKKETQKTYTRYSGFPGGLREATVADLRRKKPQEIIRHAVSGMLPKNKLRDQWLTRLYIYPTEKHPHAKQIAE
jgi:large subunit ribosomal protein L13